VAVFVLLSLDPWRRQPELATPAGSINPQHKLPGRGTGQEGFVWQRLNVD
jgi:hypothetical protein